MVADLCQAREAENTDPRANYAVTYATARGRLTPGGLRAPEEEEIT